MNHDARPYISRTIVDDGCGVETIYERRPLRELTPEQAYVRGCWDGVESALSGRRPDGPSFQPRPQPKITNIYFIGGDTGPIKIGMALDVGSRLATLRCQSPIPIGVLATVKGPPSLEREYHKRFAAHRLHGEWFSRCPEIEAEITRLVGEVA